MTREEKLLVNLLKFGVPIYSHIIGAISKLKLSRLTSNETVIGKNNNFI